MNPGWPFYYFLVRSLSITLILVRRAGETIIIEHEIRVAILGMKRNQIRLGIEAPKEVPVHCSEIAVKTLFRYPYLWHTPAYSHDRDFAYATLFFSTPLRLVSFLIWHGFPVWFYRYDYRRRGAH